ncbi:hypothetical protein [Krasilnikovia sp. M28-CT-15]|uniref:hypothetical protein n=1 Tax=Krasilnikovia sp. M28-CT-15 TaxID=3373540 RepID=UPI00387614F6
MTPNRPPSHAEAKQGVEQRMAAILQDCPGLMATPLPPVRLKQEAMQASPTAGNRVRAGAVAVNLPPDQVFAAVAEHCGRTGYQVTDTGGLDGRLLIARDPAGYGLTLRQESIEPPILIVASPEVPAWSTGGKITAGVATGMAVGFLGPCVSVAITPQPSHGSPYLPWAPVFGLAVLVCLIHPPFRAFGIGLLISGSVVGIAMAGLCSQMM